MTHLTVEESQWKPRPWLAALLGFFLTAMGMLYVQRPRLAAAYFLLALAVPIAAFFLNDLIIAGTWLLPVVCAVHSFRIARAATPTTSRAWYSRWYGLAGIPIALVTVVFIFRAFAYEPFRMRSQSMYPTISEGSVLLVFKWGYGHYGTYGFEPWRAQISAPIARGDIVVHELVEQPEIRYVTRVIGMPGDHIQYRNRRLLINGEAAHIKLGESDGHHRFAIERIGNKSVKIAFIPTRASADFDRVVPPDAYVVFGDSRDNARDSRYIGLVREENIVGVVTAIWKPRE